VAANAKRISGVPPEVVLSYRFMPSTLPVLMSTMKSARPSRLVVLLLLLSYCVVEVVVEVVVWARLGSPLGS
jgi:hypothetical protein